MLATRLRGSMLVDITARASVPSEPVPQQHAQQLRREGHLTHYHGRVAQPFNNTWCLNKTKAAVRPAETIALASMPGSYLARLVQSTYHTPLHYLLPDVPVHIYYDSLKGEFPAEAHRLGATKWINMDETIPWATARVKEMLQPPFQQRWYKSRLQLFKKPETTWMKLWWTTLPRHEIKCFSMLNRIAPVCTDPQGLFKVAALSHALDERPGRAILYLDFDAWMRAPLDARFWSFTNRYSAVTIGRRTFPETGIMAFDGSEQARAMMNLSVRMYLEDKLIATVKCISDVHVFRYSMNPTFVRSQLNFPLCRGWWAVGCRNKTSEEPWQVEVKNYSSYGDFCPGRSPELAPWNVFEYMVHGKDGRGPLHLVSRVTGPQNESREVVKHTFLSM